MLKKIGIAVIVIIVAICGLAATKPDTFSVERGTTIAAPPATVHALINDFHEWSRWSPWEKLDPAMKRTYGGPASGVGATYGWEGNGDVGAGRMEVTASVPASSVTLKLDFLKPFEAHNVIEFTLTPAGDSTKVLWRMHGPNNFLNKLISVFVSMDKMVGPDFEKGLVDLKAAAEKAVPPPATAPVADAKAPPAKK